MIPLFYYSLKKSEIGNVKKVWKKGRFDNIASFETAQTKEMPLLRYVMPILRTRFLEICHF